jgi:hypothetical protein
MMYDPERAPRASRYTSGIPGLTSAFVRRASWSSASSDRARFDAGMRPPSTSGPPNVTVKGSSATARRLSQSLARMPDHCGQARRGTRATLSATPGGRGSGHTAGSSTPQVSICPSIVLACFGNRCCRSGKAHRRGEVVADPIPSRSPAGRFGIGVQHCVTQAISADLWCHRSAAMCSRSTDRR